MRVVDRPRARPMRCAATPFLGQTSPGRWVDTGSELPGFDNHVYLHERSVAEAAKLLGFPDRAEHQHALNELARVQERVAELEAQVADRDEQIAAFGVLKRSKAIQEPRPPGRPRKNPEEVTA